MGTTENESAWSTTAATNATADAGINWAEGQDPATVNNSARGMMAGRAKARLDQGGGLAAGGTADALTVTTNQILSSGHVAAGQRLLVRATATNTITGVTFAPDGLTAANVKRVDGTALAVGSITNGMYLDLVYNGGSSEWRCANIPPAPAVAALLAATQAEQETATSTAVAVTPGRQQYHPSSAKCWAVVTVSGGTPTLQTSYNITSITDTGLGVLDITIATDFSTANWACLAMIEVSAVTRIVQTLSKAAGTVEIACVTTGGVSVDPVSWSMVGYGDQA